MTSADLDEINRTIAQKKRLLNSLIIELRKLQEKERELESELSELNEEQVA